MLVGFVSLEGISNVFYALVKPRKHYALEGCEFRFDVRDQEVFGISIQKAFCARWSET